MSFPRSWPSYLAEESLDLFQDILLIRYHRLLFILWADFNFRSNEWPSFPGCPIHPNYIIQKIIFPAPAKHKCRLKFQCFGNAEDKLNFILLRHTKKIVIKNAHSRYLKNKDYSRDCNSNSPCHWSAILGSRPFLPIPIETSPIVLSSLQILTGASPGLFFLHFYTLSIQLIPLRLYYIFLFWIPPLSNAFTTMLTFILSSYTQGETSQKQAPLSFFSIERNVSHCEGVWASTAINLFVFWQFTLIRSTHGSHCYLLGMLAFYAVYFLVSTLYLKLLPGFFPHPRISDHR